jgi:endonuclease-3 related protein
MKTDIKKIYDFLFNTYGYQHWWPYSSSNRQFEIILGTILTQNTAWKNVETAINNLAAHDLIDINKIKNIKEKQLAVLIKSSGYYNQKAERLKIISNHLSQHSSLSAFFKRPLDKIRAELLSIKGIGPETADSILLYAGSKPIFVIDAYTKRIFSRLGLCKKDIEYHDLQNLFIQALPKSTKLFNEYHALLVEHAKIHCRKKPSCSSCPLLNMCKRRIK